jgi:redox-sensing transcriptional repressor
LISENFPDSSVRRLSAYLRQLELLSAAGVTRVSSRQLAERMKVGGAQVRRDLALFGQFGMRGVGYGVEEMIANLRDILGTERRWKTAVVGAGPLGLALLRYGDFPQRGFELVAAFDVDPAKIGMNVGTVEVFPMQRLEEVIARKEVKLAILAVPAAVAQQTADRLVAGGIEGIMNFATTALQAPANVHVSQVDITAQLEQLTFQISHDRDDRAETTS